MNKKMNITYLVGGVLIGVVLSGCVSKEFVHSEINKSREELKNDLAKMIEINIANLNSELSKRIVAIETNFATRGYVKEEIYTKKLEIMKEVDAKIETIKTLVNKLKEWQDTFAFADKEDIIKISQDIKTVANVLWKQINEQVEGLKRAMNELEKLTLPQPGGAPEPYPPK